MPGLFSPRQKVDEGCAVTLGDMKILLDPLGSCLRRMEGTLQELHRASLLTKDARKCSSTYCSEEDTMKSEMLASTRALLQIWEMPAHQPVFCQQEKLGMPQLPQTDGMQAALEQETPQALSVDDKLQGSSGRTVGFSSDLTFAAAHRQPEAHLELSAASEPASDGVHVAANGEESQPKKLHHAASVFAEDLQPQGVALRIVDQMKVNMELERANMEGNKMGRKEKAFLEKMEALSIWWYSIQEPKRNDWMYRIAVDRNFESFCMLVITFNSGLVAYMADWQIRHIGEDLPTVIKLLEYACLVVFTSELILRIGAHRCYFFINNDMGWNIFDTILVSISLADVFVEVVIGMEGNSNVGFMRLLRLAKLARIFRSLRSFRFFKSLVLLLESLIRSFISLFWGFIMLCFVLYIFALIFMQALIECLESEGEVASAKDIELRETIVESFGSLGESVVSLYMAVTGGDDWSNYYHTVACAGGMYGWVFVFYTFVLYFALFNIVTGTLVEKAMSSHKPDRAERVLNQRKLYAEQRKQFLDIFRAMDIDSNGMISRSEFMACMTNPAVLAYMASIDIAVADIDLFFETVGRVTPGVSSDDLEVPIDQFVEGCMQMKGNATAIDMQKQLYQTFLIHENLLAVKDELRRISKC